MFEVETGYLTKRSMMRRIMLYVVAHHNELLFCRGADVKNSNNTEWAVGLVEKETGRAGYGVIWFV